MLQQNLFGIHYFLLSVLFFKMDKFKSKFTCFSKDRDHLSAAQKFCETEKKDELSKAVFNFRLMVIQINLETNLAEFNVDGPQYNKKTTLKHQLSKDVYLATEAQKDLSHPKLFLAQIQDKFSEVSRLKKSPIFTKKSELKTKDTKFFVVENYIQLIERDYKLFQEFQEYRKTVLKSLCNNLNTYEKKVWTFSTSKKIKEDIDRYNPLERPSEDFRKASGDAKHYKLQMQLIAGRIIKYHRLIFDSPLLRVEKMTLSTIPNISDDEDSS